MKTTSPGAVPGPLILLGGMGLQPGFAPAWKDIVARLPGPILKMIILPVTQGDHQPAIGQRARLVQETFSCLGMATQIVGGYPLPGFPQVATLFKETDCLFLMAGESPVPLANTLSQWHSAGMAMIATAGMATLLGDHTLAPTKPYPPMLETLAFELQPGAGILSGAAVLPYFDRFPGGLLDKLETLYPPETMLIGIDEKAAMVSGTAGWHVAGFGSVTILIHNQVAHIAKAGSDIPGQILPPFWR